MDTGSAAQVCGSSLREEASLSGQQRGRDTLIRKIGQGGYASIYLGVHHYLNTYVALKLLNRSLTSDEGVKRFQIKSRILAHLRHTLLSSVLCRKASIECCKMLGTSCTPSAQTWSPARCSTSSTGSPEALVIADLDERFIQESSASLCILRWLIGPSVGAGVPVARRETRRCSTFERSLLSSLLLSPMFLRRHTKDIYLQDVDGRSQVGSGFPRF